MKTKKNFPTLAFLKIQYIIHAHIKKKEERMTLMILTVLIGPTLLFGLAFFLSQEAIFIMQDIYDKTGYINTTALQNVIHYKQITADYMIDSINIIPWIIAKKLLIDKEKNMNAIYDED